jgi:hypothetical protein
MLCGVRMKVEEGWINTADISEILSSLQ